MRHSTKRGARLAWLGRGGSLGRGGTFAALRDRLGTSTLSVEGMMHTTRVATFYFLTASSSMQLVLDKRSVDLLTFAGSSRYQYFVGRRDDAYLKSSDHLFSHNIKFNATCAR